MKETMRPVTPKQVSIEDALWSRYDKLVREVVIPYQYEALHDNVPGAEPSHAVNNFRIAAGQLQGEYGGLVFQDSDLAKYLEAVGYSLMTHPDPELERRADELIALIAAAQQEDGYLNTYFTVKEPGKRWTNLQECHELYCAGHMMEAAVAYYEATGKRRLLDVMCRYADHIDDVFGPEEGKLRGYDGHQEIELALVKLHRVTGNDRYLRLARFFIDERGQKPSFFEEEWEQLGRVSHWNGSRFTLDLKYHQAHLPVREQSEAVGHAVRALYMYGGMADLALLDRDESLYDACVKLWNNTVRKQMYITGGVGSNHEREAFSVDYELPNDTAYAETCASIALILFASRMLRIEAKGEYADVLERALYNTVLAGMAQDGKHYFYVNPLEVWPSACKHNPGKHHVKPVRQPWFGCACCPPNAARLLASLGQYAYGTSGDTIYTHLYVGGELMTEVEGTAVKLNLESDYTWNGKVKLTVEPASQAAFTIALRIPGWAGKACELRVNGETHEVESIVRDGYAYVRREWKAGDRIDLTLPMQPRWIEANPQVRANAGKAAIQRGPLVYCLEEADNGAPVMALSVDVREPLTERYDAEFFGGAVLLEGVAYRDSAAGWEDELYREAERVRERTAFTAIPYYLWGNRGEGDMAVWVRAW